MKYCVSALLAVSLAGTASAQAVTEMPPAGPWQVSYNDQSCDLGRVFAHDGKEVELQIRSFSRAGGTQQFIVASKDIGLSPKSVTMEAFPVSEKLTPLHPFRTALARGFEGKLFNVDTDFDFKAIEDAYRAFLLETPILDEDQRRFMLRLHGERTRPISQSERMQDANVAAAGIAAHAFLQSDAYKAARTRSLESIESLRFNGVFVKNVALKTGSMVAAFKAMDDCVENLHRHWGIDVEAHKTLTRPVLALGSAEVLKKVAASYPVGMALRGQQAVTAIRLNISAEGLPTACFPLNEGANPAFNTAVCDVFMEHAKFSPALDAAGAPIASYYTQSVSFGLN